MSTRAAEAEMKQLRNKIDRIDAQILKLLAQRLRIVARVGRIKIKLGLPIIQNKRWAEIIKSKTHQAQQLGLSKKLVRAIYDLIGDEAIRIQKKTKRA